MSDLGNDTTSKVARHIGDVVHQLIAGKDRLAKANLPLCAFQFSKNDRIYQKLTSELRQIIEGVIQ